MLKMLITLLIVPFLYSCQNSATAQEYSLKKEVAYVQVAKTKHTKRARKQQHDICERLKRIQKRIEKRKTLKRKGGK
jgi:hypothetical protein